MEKITRDKHSGNYTCEVENTLGTDKITYQIHVQGKCTIILGLHTLFKVLYILESRDFSQAEKERTACKGEQIHNSQKLEDM